VLELRGDEDGFCDVADRGRAEHDVLQGVPPLEHQRQACGCRYSVTSRDLGIFMNEAAGAVPAQDAHTGHTADGCARPEGGFCCSARCGRSPSSSLGGIQASWPGSRSRSAP
jgi:hypothetical protein